MKSYSCYIELNSKFLREKLEMLGYKYGGSDKQSIGTSALYCNDGKYYEIYQSKPSRSHLIYDCGTNEVLFLAIAALNNKTDKHQWFICQREYITHNMKVINIGDWQLNTQFDKLTCGLKLNWIKATIKELIEHFK